MASIDTAPASLLGGFEEGTNGIRFDEPLLDVESIHLRNVRETHVSGAVFIIAKNDATFSDHIFPSSFHRIPFPVFTGCRR